MPAPINIDTSCTPGQNVIGNLVPFVDCSNGSLAATNPVTDGVYEGLGKVMSALATFWISTPSPELTVGRLQAGGRSPIIAFLQDSLAWYTAGFMILAILFTAGRMMFDSWRSDAPSDFGRGIGNYLVSAGAGVSIIASLVYASDLFSIWIIERATTGPDFGQGLARALTGGQGLGMVLVLVIGVLAILVALAQILLLLWRNACLVVLAATLPLASSASMTPRGQEWFTTQVGWIIAYIAYKPAASIVYATSFKLIGDGAQDDAQALINACTGLMLMFLAVAALPAVIRLAVPATQRLAQGRGAGGAVSSAAMVAMPMAASRFI